MARAGDGKKRSDSRKRHNLLQKRVNDAELAGFIARARKAGFQDHREYHDALISGDVGFDRRQRCDLLRILGELGKQGSNLNQLAHAVNSGRITALSADDLRVIHEARTAVENAAAQIRVQLA
ncbi:plasmid mobilization relaxosome protein MobC [Natronohydrobacter thiooxidans]|uniref:plasmid mobilization relaxosome protein MobC n=1 Tax=Natronohydrobacter thiooxidans TaxID=87172 RepID=UPI000AC097E3|nr:plasmid mobilization relaxosome protein MobC [Natronohydrobacter thiooxidans]